MVRTNARITADNRKELVDLLADSSRLAPMQVETVLFGREILRLSAETDQAALWRCDYEDET